MGRNRAAAHPGVDEKTLIQWGYIKHQNSLGVVYYVNPEDSALDWIEDTNHPGNWKQVPWSLVENEYTPDNNPGPTRETETGQPGREVTAAALGERIAAIYGEILVGGDVFLQKLIGNIYRLGYGLGHGEMDSVQKAYANYQGNPKYDMTSNTAYWMSTFKNGAINQTAAQIIADAKGVLLANCPIFPGLAYMAWLWAFDQQSMPEVPDPKFLVRGRKCYDPRLDTVFLAGGAVTRNSTTVVWTRNPALILADYIVNDWFGLGLGDDGLDWNSVIDAANYCGATIAVNSVTDVTVTSGGQNITGTASVTFSAPPAGAGARTATGTCVLGPDPTGTYNVLVAVTIADPGDGYTAGPPTLSYSGFVSPPVTTAVLGEQRHRMDIALRRKATHKANIETLRQHFRCSFTERKGKIAFIIDNAKALSYTFTADNARAVSGNSRGTSKVPSASILTWTNPKKDWQQDQNYAYTTNCKNGVEEYRPAEWTQEGVIRQNEAARNNAYLLGKQRANLGTVLELITTDGHQLERGDRVRVIFDVLAMPGGVDFTIETIKDNGNGRFMCDVSYYNPALFADTVGVVESTINLGVPDPYANLGAPTGLVLTESVDEFVPGVYTPKLVVGFTPFGSVYYGGTKITYSVNGGATVNRGTFDQGPVTIPITEGVGASVTVNLYTVNKLSQKAGTAVLTGSHTMYNPNAPEAISAIIYDLAGGVYWAKPPIRTQAVITSANWFASGTSTWSPTLIEDGNQSSLALRFTASVVGLVSPANTGAYVAFGNGANWVRELHVYWSDSLATFNETLFRPFYSTNAGATTVEPANWTRLKISDNHTVYYLGDVPNTANFIGLAPYLTAPATNVAGIAEIVPFTYGASYQYIKGYRLTGLDLQGNLWQKDILYTPDVLHPIKLEEWTSKTWRYYPEYDATLLTNTHTLLSVQVISPTNDLSEKREYESFSVSLPTGTPVNVQLGTGSTLTTSPPAGDNSTKIATTAFVQSEGMQKVTGAPGFNIVGAQNAATRPSGCQLQINSTSSMTYVTALSITGKGALRFLSWGSVNGLIKVTVDGAVIYNGLATFNNSGTYFGSILVGSVVSTPDPLNAGWWNFDAIPGGDGFTFKTSLLIEIKGVSGSTVGTAFDYVLY